MRQIPAVIVKKWVPQLNLIDEGQPVYSLIDPKFVPEEICRSETGESTIITRPAEVIADDSGKLFISVDSLRELLKEDFKVRL